MKWPDKVNVCGKTYNIVYCETRDDITPEADCWGMHLGPKREIRVLDSENEYDTLDTLLHEIIHAIFYDMKVLCDMIAEGKEEVVTHELASVLVDTLLRNGLVKLEER